VEGVSVPVMSPPCPLSLPSLVRAVHPNFKLGSPLNPESGTTGGSLILESCTPTLETLATILCHGFGNL
jgi:hypothetical protein